MNTNIIVPQSILDVIKKGGFPYFYAGGTSNVIEEYLNEQGCVRLQSYATERNNIIKRAKNGQMTFVDSGAYSAMTKGIDINIDDYIEFINQYDDSIILACQWDRIPDAKTDPETSAKETWNNYLYMRERVKSPEKLLYVWHSAEDIKWLQQALEFKPRINYMALGGLVGKSVKQRDEAMKKCFDTIAKSSNPDIMVHAFGMSNRKLLDKYPFTSADSTSWFQAARFGCIQAVDFKSFLVSDRKIEDSDHIYNLPEETRKAVEIDVSRLGYTIDDVVNDVCARRVYQAKYWNDYFSNFRQTAENPVTKLLKKNISLSVTEQEVESVVEDEEEFELW